MGSWWRLMTSFSECVCKWKCILINATDTARHAGDRQWLPYFLLEKILDLSYEPMVSALESNFITFFLVCFADCRDQNFRSTSNQDPLFPTPTLSFQELIGVDASSAKRSPAIRLPRGKSVYSNLWESAYCCATPARQTESPGPP